MKTCNKCKEIKCLSDFNKNKNKIDGYHHWCRECVSINNKKLYKNNTDIIKNKTSKYYYENKENILSKNKLKPSYSLTHPEYYKEYRLKNKDSYREYIKNYKKKRRDKDDIFRTIENIRSHVSKYLKNNKGDIKTEKLLGYTYDTFIKTIGVVSKNYNLDHKVPVSWFKIGTPVSIIWHLDNLQIITEKHNKQKLNLYSDEIPTEYYDIIKKWVRDDKLNQIK